MYKTMRGKSPCKWWLASQNFFVLIFGSPRIWGYCVQLIEQHAFAYCLLCVYLSALLNLLENHYC